MSLPEKQWACFFPFQNCSSVRWHMVCVKDRLFCKLIPTFSCVNTSWESKSKAIGSVNSSSGTQWSLKVVTGESPCSSHLLVSAPWWHPQAFPHHTLTRDLVFSRLAPRIGTLTFSQEILSQTLQREKFGSETMFFTQVETCSIFVCFCFLMALFVCVW